MSSRKWTHHHAVRSYHSLTFSVTVVTVAFFAWSFGIALTLVVPNVSNDEFGPSPAVLGESTESISPQDADPKITVVPGESIQQRYVLRDGEVQPIFIFPTQYPKFIGQTNVKNSTAVFDMFGPNHITGKTKVDSNGNWAWESTVPLKPGAYMFTVKAVEGNADKATAQDSLLFEVVLEKTQKVAEIEINNIKQLGNNGNLFDVRTTILEQYKAIKPGDEFQADIKFVNIGTPGKPVDVEVRYAIRNSKDEIVSENTETVAVSNELVYNKTFPTADSIAPGFYTLTVAIPSEDLVATATDSFEIVSTRNAGSLITENPIFTNRTLMLEVLGGIIFLGILIGYIEYNKVIILTRRIRRVTEKDVLRKTKVKPI